MFTGYNYRLWGIELGFRRISFSAHQLPDDYTLGGGGFTVSKKVKEEMNDDANLWSFGLLRKWKANRTKGGHFGLSGGLALTDFFENHFTYTGVQVSGSMFLRYSPNYSTIIERQLLPGAYLRGSFELPVSKGFSLEAAVWTSYSSKVKDHWTGSTY